MADDVAEKPEKPRIRAEDNPWYWLATLYGVPDRSDEELQIRNRVAWNRCMASKLTDEARDNLIKTNRHPAEELAPFSPDELEEVEAAVLQRSGGRAAGVAELGQSEIDFSDTDFEYPSFFSGMIFPRVIVSFHATFAGYARFDGATFGGNASFEGATFTGYARFDGATFGGNAHFDGVTFAGYARFDGATFAGYARFDGATFGGNAGFEGATFTGDVIFGHATFSGSADFSGATFSGSAGFINVEMKAPTSFQRAKFFAPPEFFRHGDILPRNICLTFWSTTHIIRARASALLSCADYNTAAALISLLSNATALRCCRLG